MTDEPLLAADIGNSHTVARAARRRRGRRRLAGRDRRAAHRRRVGGAAPRAARRRASTRSTGSSVCATVPAVLHEWRDDARRATSATCRSVVVEPGVRTGVPVLTDNPREVGTDRIVNALAAATRYGGPAIVVDFGGTATTFDVVNAQGQYVGGAISPGIEISLEALERRGAQLRMVELRRPRSVIAKNTVEALQSGMVFGVASQVDGIVARMIAELGGRPRRRDGGRHRLPGRRWWSTSAAASPTTTRG